MRRRKGGWGEEKILMSAKGRWKETITHSDGTVTEGGWSPNQIQNTASDLLAGLLRRAGEDPSYSGFKGLLYLAVGSGDVSWDVTAPIKDPAQVALQSEYFRKQIIYSDLNFLDPLGAVGAPAVGYVSRKILINVTLLSNEANGARREFGLYGGDATLATDSGLIFNWVSHPLSNKTSGETINLSIEILLLLPGDCP